MKSTLAIHMAVELTTRGKKAAIIDLDPQATVGKWHKRRAAEWPVCACADAAGLAKALQGMNGMDVILLDLPGRRGEEMYAGMRAADFIIVPSRPLDTDLEASGDTIAAAQRLGKPYAFAMTIVPPDGRRAREFMRKIAERGIPILRTFIGQRLSYPDATAAGKGVAEYEPNSKASTEIQAFTIEVMKGIK